MLRRRPAPPRASTRVVRRAPDGTLSNVDDGATVTLAEIRDDLQGGRYFRASRSDTGVDCTNEVLAELIREAVPDAEASLITMYNPLLRLLGEDDARS